MKCPHFHDHLPFLPLEEAQGTKEFLPLSLPTEDQAAPWFTLETIANIFFINWARTSC